jgi:hypothetical protein
VSSFWELFWPTLAATLAGVVVGVPIALWVNRAALRATIRREESLSRDRLRSGLESVLAALSHNKNQLGALAARFGQDRPPFEASVDASAWDESREEVVPFLKVPDLQRRIAWHFSRLKSVLRLNALYVELAVGLGMRATPNTLNAGSADLRAFLTREIRELLAEIDALKAEVQEVIPNNTGSE